MYRSKCVFFLCLKRSPSHCAVTKNYGLHSWNKDYSFHPICSWSRWRSVGYSILFDVISHFSYLKCGKKQRRRFFQWLFEGEKININFVLLHIWLMASSYMVKYFCLSSYIRKPFLIYDFAPDPIWISLYCIWGKFYFLFIRVDLIGRMWVQTSSRPPRTWWWGSAKRSRTRMSSTTSGGNYIFFIKKETKVVFESTFTMLAAELGLFEESVIK